MRELGIVLSVLVFLFIARRGTPYQNWIMLANIIIAIYWLWAAKKMEFKPGRVLAILMAIFSFATAIWTVLLNPKPGP